MSWRQLLGDTEFGHKIINLICPPTLLSISGLGLFSSPLADLLMELIKNIVFISLGIWGALGHYIANKEAYHKFFNFKKKNNEKIP